jgi:hypothetical protein
MPAQPYKQKTLPSFDGRVPVIKSKNNYAVTSTRGAAANISALAAEAYCSKFFTNELARLCAV